MATRKANKHVLNAAKQQIEGRFQLAIEKLEIDIANTRECGDASLLEELELKLDQVYDEYSEWSSKGKTNKKKIGKRVEWTGERPEPQRRTTTASLTMRRAERKEGAKMEFPWCTPGALVCRRGKSEALMVIALAGAKAQVMIDGQLEWLRAKQLRPVGD